MKLLLDTHLLLWVAGEPNRLTPATIALIDTPENQLFFSVVSLWEIIIKSGLGRSDFQLDAKLLRYGLLNNGYTELYITSDHVLAIGRLPLLHKDPFDRMLIAQAKAEDIILLTTDAAVALYPAPISWV